MKEKLVPSFSGYSSQTSLIIWAVSLVVLLATIILGIISYHSYYTNSVSFFITTTPPVLLYLINYYSPLSIDPVCLTIFVGIIIACSLGLFLFLLFGKLVANQSNSIGSFFTNKTILFIFGFLFTCGEFLMNLCKPKDNGSGLDKTICIFGIIFSGLSFLAFFFTHYSLTPGNNKIVTFFLKKVFMAPLICFHLYYLCCSIGGLFLENGYNKQDTINLIQGTLLAVFIVLIGMMVYILKDFILGIISIIVFIGMIIIISTFKGGFYGEKQETFHTITLIASILGIIVISAEIIGLIFIFRFRML